MIYTLSFRLSRPVHSGRLFVGTHIPPVIPPYSAHNPAQPPPLSSRLPSSAPRSRPLPTPPPARQYERAGVGGRGGCGVCSYTPHWAVFRVACGRGPCGRVLVGCFRPLGASWGPPGGRWWVVLGLAWCAVAGAPGGPRLVPRSLYPRLTMRGYRVHLVEPVPGRTGGRCGLVEALSGRRWRRGRPRPPT